MWRTVAALAALWWILIVAPALVATRLLGHAGAASAKGWVLGVWLAGYVLQFVVFLMMSRRAPRPAVLGWVIAATVPWAADWTAPLSLWWLLLWTVVVVGYAVWLVADVSQVDRLRSAGEPGSGVVLEVIRPTFNVVVNKDASRRVLRVRVERPDGTASYETRVTATFTLGELPEADDRVALRIDPTRPSHIELIEDEPIVRAAPQPADLAPDVAERLKTLKTMRDRGDLTDTEFATARRRLLESPAE